MSKTFFLPPPVRVRLGQEAEKERDLPYLPRVNNREMNPHNKVEFVIHLVSHNAAHLQEQTAQNVKQSFLSKYIWSKAPSPLSMVHSAACKIMLQSLRSISSRIDKEVNVPAGGMMTS